MKRYRLLKDGVGCSGVIPKWTVVEKESSENMFYYTCDKDHSPFKNDFVENNPEVFEAEHKCKHCGAMTFQPDEECWNYPKTEPIPSQPKEFVWDREPFDKFEVGVEKLINSLSLENVSDTPDYISAEFIRKVFELFNKAITERTRWYAPDPKSSPPSTAAEKFNYSSAQGYQPKRYQRGYENIPDEKSERHPLGVGRRPMPSDFPPESPHDMEWGMCNYEKYSAALKRWEEKNPPPPTSETKPDCGWEILEMKLGMVAIKPKTQNDIPYWLERGFDIIKVIRKSDSTTWSVGEDVCGFLGEKGKEIRIEFKIKSFRIENENMLVIGYGGEQFDISFIQKNYQPQSTTNEQPIERIELSVCYGHVISLDQRLYQIWVNNRKWIPEEKFPAIKKAVEAAVNGDDNGFWDKINSVTDNAIKETIKYKYTQSELDEAIKNTWDAARKTKEEGSVHVYLNNTFKDYLQSLNQK